jgi:Zn-dependent protease
MNIVFESVLRLFPFILALTVHEWAHAASAYKLGDDTAKLQGRLTLNPIVHIDLMGTIVLPLMGIPFGWAKPVPVNPAKFNRNVNMRTGMALTAAAGPISNFVLAIVTAIILGIMIRFRIGDAMIQHIVVGFITLNVSLGLFNLLPVPPLDGSRIADRFLSTRFPTAWGFVEKYSSYMFLAVFFFGSKIIAGPAAAVDRWLFKLVWGIAGQG